MKFPGLARHGEACEGPARQGLARLGQAGRPTARPGGAWRGKAWPGLVWNGEARPGQARQSKAWRGDAGSPRIPSSRARPGAAGRGRRGRARHDKPRPGEDGQGGAGRGRARLGLAWHGMALFLLCACLPATVPKSETCPEVAELEELEIAIAYMARSCSKLEQTELELNDIIASQDDEIEDLSWLVEQRSCCEPACEACDELTAEDVEAATAFVNDQLQRLAAEDEKRRE